MDTAFQPDAFQPDAFQILGGDDDEGDPETAFQMDAFQADAFQIYGGPDDLPPAVTGGHHAVRRFLYPDPIALEDEELVLLI